MIEETVLGFLAGKLGTEVHAQVPERPPGAFVVVKKAGSGEENGVFSALVTVDSYAESLLGAARMNEQVKKAMKELARLDEICRVQLNTDYNYTDTASRRYRYRAVFDITHY